MASWGRPNACYIARLQRINYVTRVAVIGAGHWGPNLARNFHQIPDCEVGWIVDKDRARLDRLKPLYRTTRLLHDAQEVLRDPACDAVVIATPVNTHFALCKSALENGKHVFCEKPLTSNLEDALALKALAESHKRVLMTGHVFLFNPGVRKIRQYLREGLLGRVYHISAVRTNLGQIRTDVDVSWDLAAHDISIANYWLEAAPLAVSAVGGNWINNGIPDAVFATLRYPDKVLVNIHVSWLNPRKVRDIVVVGSKKMLTFDDTNTGEPIRIYDKGMADMDDLQPEMANFGVFKSKVRDGDILIPRLQGGEPLKAECEHFIACVRGAKCESGPDEAIAVVKTLCAVQRSIANAGKEEVL